MSLQGSKSTSMCPFMNQISFCLQLGGRRGDEFTSSPIGLREEIIKFGVVFRPVNHVI